MKLDKDVALAAGLMVSRETMARLNIYETLLRRWQARINLVSNSTLDDVRRRHFADSAQIFSIAPHATVWADLGSGAGFPGLVIALLLREQGVGRVHLIESDAKKCAFLREVIRETGALAEVHRGRIEDELPNIHPQVVTARALANLTHLLDLAARPLANGALGIFLKGREIESELTALPARDKYEIEIMPSISDQSGRIAVVSAQPV